MAFSTPIEGIIDNTGRRGVAYAVSGRRDWAGIKSGSKVDTVSYMALSRVEKSVIRSLPGVKSISFPIKRAKSGHFGENRGLYVGDDDRLVVPFDKIKRYERDTKSTR